MSGARRRQAAVHLVQRWAVRLEQLDLSPTHPLQQLREQAMATQAAKHGVVFGSEHSAHGVATAARGGATVLSIHALDSDEGDRIMRHVGVVGMQYRKAVYLVDGLGVGEREAARLLKISRSTLQVWREAGLAIVQSCQLTRCFNA